MTLSIGDYTLLSLENKTTTVGALNCVARSKLMAFSYFYPDWLSQQPTAIHPLKRDYLVLFCKSSLWLRDHVLLNVTNCGRDRAKLSEKACEPSTLHVSPERGPNESMSHDRKASLSAEQAFCRQSTKWCSVLALSLRTDIGHDSMWSSECVEAWLAKFTRVNKKSSGAVACDRIIF